MGDPRKTRAKFHGPLKPWEEERLAEEKELMKEYGLVNKKEIYRVNSLYRKFLSQTKHLSASRLNPAKAKQAEKEIEHLLTKLKSLKIIHESAKLDDVLNISTRNIFERRLQTLVYKKGLARSIKQARQFIVHRHIMVNGKPITSPAYLVSKEEENTVTFKPTSGLSNPEHPERAIQEPKQKKSDNKESKEDAKKKEKEEKNKEEKSTKKELKDEVSDKKENKTHKKEENAEET